ncbi:Meckelin like protein, partial [Aduncisulcus paluster]
KAKEKKAKADKLRAKKEKERKKKEIERKMKIARAKEKFDKRQAREARKKPKPPKQGDVSCWRRLFVANQWAKLQASRHTSTAFTILTTLFIFYLIGWWSKDVYSSQIIRIFYICLCISIISLIQWVFRAAILTRIVPLATHSFPSLLSTCNCSLLVLCDGCAGYYIHGACVHSSADVSLEKLHRHLRLEEERAFVGRGLVVGSEEQVYRLFATSAFKRAFTSLMMSSNMERTQINTNRMIGIGGGGRAAMGKAIRSDARGSGASGAAGGVGTASDTELYHHSMFEKELKRVFSGADSSISTGNEGIRRKRSDRLPFKAEDLGVAVISARTCIQNVFDWPLDANALSSHVLCPEKGVNFENAFLCGIEWNLITMTAMLMCAFDKMCNNNILLAAFLTFVLVEIIGVFRVLFAQSTIGKTTLIGKEFIM